MPQLKKKTIWKFENFQDFRNFYFENWFLECQFSVFLIKFSKILKIFEFPTWLFFRWGTRNTFYLLDFPHTNPPNPTWYDRFRLRRSLQKKTLTRGTAARDECTILWSCRTARSGKSFIVENMFIESHRHSQFANRANRLSQSGVALPVWSLGEWLLDLATLHRQPTWRSQD